MNVSFKPFYQNLFGLSNVHPAWASIANGVSPEFALVHNKNVWPWAFWVFLEGLNPFFSIEERIVTGYYKGWSCANFCVVGSAFSLKCRQ